ncbi:MAG: FAD:protein FMN transferase [Sutterellaceae bacterium]|nr:FAD:protein FMN transferase [Burkholderiaceae bacterium]MCX7901470.1 FAD:protein FMN transferase [Burkholderiaceae bacterium]MDW8430352.1 FAD:protein FMN transferase [Sutterellaceae bacterium]
MRRIRGAQTTDGWYVREAAIMGTAIRVELWSEDRAQAEAAIEAVLAEMRRIDAAYSPFKPESELSRLNREAAQRAVPVSDEFFALLARALEFSERSQGAFDVTFAAVGALYDYRRGIRPSEAQRTAALQAVGYRHLQLDASTRSVRFARAGMRIDLGGFAKGYAVDRAAAIVARHGITHAMITAGGDSRIVGDRRGRPWMIGVRDPRRPGEVVAVLPLADVAVSTSGDYERFFEADGRRYHHVLDPRTGESPAHVRAVTVIADDGVTAEALGKCVFVMGAQKGLQFVASYPGADAVVVDANGALAYTPGFSDDRHAHR